MQTFILSWNIYLSLFVFFAWEPAELRTNEDAWNGYNQRSFCFKAELDHHFNCCKLFFCRVAVIYLLQESSEHYWLQTQSLCNHPVLTVCPKRKNKIMKRVQIKILAQYNGSLISGKSGINKNKQTKHS